MYIECRHLFPSGKKCASPALTAHDFCYFHHNQRHQKPPRKSGQPSTVAHRLPQLEDSDTILTALSDVILALAANRIDPRRAQILLYGLQVASQHNRHLNHPSSLEPVREAWQHDDGTLVGPRQQRYDTSDLTLDDEETEEDEDETEEDQQLLEAAERYNRELDERLKEKRSNPSPEPEESVVDQIQATATTPRQAKRPCRTHVVESETQQSHPRSVILSEAQRSRRTRMNKVHAKPCTARPALHSDTSSEESSNHSNSWNKKQTAAKKRCRTFAQSTDAPLIQPDPPFKPSNLRNYARKHILLSFPLSKSPSVNS